MPFDDTFCQPISRPLAFAQIAIYGPSLAAGSRLDPTRIERRREDWVFDGEHQTTPGDQRRSHFAKQMFEVVQIVKRERAVNECIGCSFQLNRLEVFTRIGDGWVVRHGAGTRQHQLRYVDTGNSRSTLLARPTAEPSVPTTKI